MKAFQFLAVTALTFSCILPSNAELLFKDDFSAYGVNTSDLNQNLPAVDGSALPTVKVRQSGTVGSYGYSKQGGDWDTQLGNAATDAGQAGAPSYADYLLIAYSGGATCHLPINEAMAQGKPLTISFDMGAALLSGSTDPTWWIAFRLGSSGSAYPVVGSAPDFAFLFRINQGLQVFSSTVQGAQYASMQSHHFTLVLTDTAGNGSAFSGNGSKVTLYNGTSLIGDYDCGQFTEKYLNFQTSQALGSIDNLTVERGVPSSLADGFRIIQTALNVSQDKLSLAWNSQFGQSYQVIHSPALTGPWTPVGGIILADDKVASTVINTTSAGDFVRVKQLSVAESGNGQPQIVQNTTNRTVTMANGKGDLQIRLSYAGCCMLDYVRVNGSEVVASQTGVSTGIEVNGNWVTTRSLAVAPHVSVSGNLVTVDNIQFANGGVAADETWQFQVASNNIQWSIFRNYLSGGTVDDSYFPGWDFTSVGTWTAGILDTGGVAWMRYLASGSSYGAHSGGVAFWKGDTCLKVTPKPVSGQFLASRFSQQPSGLLSFVQSVNSQPLATQHFLHRSISGLDVWAPFQVAPGTVQTTLTLETPNPADLRYRGSFNGIDGAAVGDVLDTLARYGVVDQQIVGGNGWLSGYVCLHEPFFAEMGLAIGDSNYTANLATSLDAWRDHALQPGGRVYSRWHHDSGDNTVPGTYDPATGYYECGWGYLLDSNSDYPINVAEEFDLNGDLAWLQSQKEPCERALDWLLDRDSNGNGLVEMVTDSHTQGKSSDWIDVVWASWENAFVNAKLYNALTLWTEREVLLGDSAKADQYRAAAAQLKQSFIKPLSQGGFWDSTNGWFAYWRDKDGSIHGDNLVTPVNFAAVAYGLCDTNQQQRILDGIQTRMAQENLFHWPICFLPFAPDEGAAGATFPTYENGDIFLSWGELAVRAYSQYNPSIAVSYINRLLAQYRNDGLSFQRYLRVGQTGAGDDILAGNSMTVVGLYRDIYGIRPQWNRLLLAPHLTPELAGTRLSYPLRGQTYVVTLDAATASATVSNFTVTAATPFALNAASGQVSFWPGSSDAASLKIDRQPDTAVQLQMLTWSGTPAETCSWTESSSTAQSLSHSMSGLSPGLSYSLSVDGSFVQSITADSAGKLTFQRFASAGESAMISLKLAQ